jgi:hypothetical protein
VVAIKSPRVRLREKSRRRREDEKKRQRGLAQWRWAGRARCGRPRGSEGGAGRLFASGRRTPWPPPRNSNSPQPEMRPKLPPAPPTSALTPLPLLFLPAPCGFAWSAPGVPSLFRVVASAVSRLIWFPRVPSAF